jgi:predicted PurR-regulated permease PerM
LSIPGRFRSLALAVKPRRATFDAHMASEQGSRRALLVLVLVAIVLLVMVARPFAEAFFLAAVLAGAVSPLMERLARRVRGKRGFVAGLFTVAVVLLLLAPVTGLAAFVINNATDAVRYVRETVRSEGMNGLIQRLPDPVERGVSWGMDKLPGGKGEVESTLNEQVSSQGGKAAAAVGGALSATGSFVFQAVMMLIAFYFLLVDGHRLVEWTEQVSPLRKGQTKEILAEFRKTSVAVLVSSVATSGVQAVAALVGYIIARVPHPLFFAAVTFFVAFIPAVGAAGVCLAAAALLFATGHPWMALFLAIWGITVVGLVDNVVKPILVRRGMDLHGAIVFFALLGGLAAFGTVGLLIGPLVVAFFLAVVRIWHRDFGRGPQAAQIVAEATDKRPLPPGSPLKT